MSDIADVGFSGASTQDSSVFDMFFRRAQIGIGQYSGFLQEVKAGIVADAPVPCDPAKNSETAKGSANPSKTASKGSADPSKTAS